ncbi:MAG: hypothetical protein R6T98_00280 [Desulfatiglandales bacterium]
MLMSAIKTEHISGEQPPHCGSQRHLAGSKQEMIRDQYPPITGRLGFRKQHSQTIKEVLPILVVPKYLSTLYAPDHNMMKDTGSIQSD